MQRSLQEFVRKEMERFRAEMACKDEQAQEDDCRDLDLEAATAIVQQCTTSFTYLYNLETELKNTKTLESADIIR